jgi:MFS family permease
MRTNNRWVIAIAGVFLQIALGAVYAWSVFRVPLAKQFGWSISEITLTFTISIFVLGFAAFFGGLWLNRKGPRIVALTGGALYGLGVFLASFSHSLSWLYLTYGVIGGIGLGFAYIVPVAVLVKWFPDRRGLITGIAVGGFGAGALITAPVATRLIQSVGVLSTFAYLGIAYLIVTLISGFFMQNPPDGWKLKGLDADSNRNFAPREPRFHAQRGTQDLAVVGALAASLSKHVRRHFGHFAGGSPFSGTHQSKRDSRCQHGRISEYRQRSGARLLGVDFRFDHEARNILRDVRWPGFVVLVLPQYRDCLVDDARYIRGIDVLRRRIWHDAGVCR